MKHNTHIGAKVNEDVARTLKIFCKHRDETVSTVLRRLVLTELVEYSYLSAEEKRALGVLEDE